MPLSQEIGLVCRCLMNATHLHRYKTFLRLLFFLKKCVLTFLFCQHFVILGQLKYISNMYELSIHANIYFSICNIVDIFID